jgi:hypothetical protein
MSKVNVLVAWLPNDEEDIAQTLLIAAFDAYVRSDYQPAVYDQCVIPANTAVEVALSQLIATWLREQASSDNVKEFLNNGATYSPQLNVLMPAMVKAIGGPQLPDHIRGSLNHLRKLRNQLAHSGTPDAPIAKSDAAEFLCSAFFGVGYVRMIEQRYFDLQ